MSGSAPDDDTAPKESSIFDERPGLDLNDDPNDPDAISPDVIAPDIDKPNTTGIGPL